MDRDIVERLLGEMARLRAALEAEGAADAGIAVDVDRAQWLAGILGHSPDVISIMDLDGRLLYLSRAVGRDPGELVGRDSADFLPPANREVWRRALHRAIATREPQRIEIESVRELWWETRIAPITKNGQVTYLLSIGHDVTERRRSERALAQLRQERDLALEASGMGQWRWNIARDEVTGDAATKRMLHWPADQEAITHAAFLARIHPEERARVEEHHARTLATGRYADLQCRLLDEGGRVRWILMKGIVSPGHDGQDGHDGHDGQDGHDGHDGHDGKPTELFGGMVDITESKEVEAGQRRIQKLDAIGQLAGGVAHDFNNLLVAIMGNVDMAKRAPPESQQAMLDEALKASKRAGELTKQLLAFGRRESAPETPENLNDLLADTLKLLRRLIPESIEIDFIAAHHLPLVLADRGQLEQVVMNLSVNARDAMPDGGRLVLETETVVINGRFRESHPWARAGRYVLLTVSDTGTGIPPEHLDRVFDPFFTTKELGTGLGLATVYGIIKRHGGLIHVYSEPGQGTTFKIYLPISERGAAQVGSKLENVVRGGTETILVAEDDELVRAMVVRILVEAGYRLLTAHDGVSAVEVFRAHSGEIDLILLDAVMPRRSGAEALSDIRALAPHVRVVMSSGYSSTVGNALTTLDVGFLPKPYEPDALLRAVRRALDSAGVSPRR